MKASPPPFQAAPPPLPFNPEDGEEAKAAHSQQNAVPLFKAPEADLEIGLSWTFKDEPVEMDVQAVFFDGAGTVVDACYYNRTSIFDGAVLHSGDALEVKPGDDETVTIDLDKLPKNANIIAVLLTCFSKMDFDCVRSAQATLRNQTDVLHILNFDLNNSSTAFAMCLLYRASDGVWYVRDTTSFPEAFGSGRSFQEASDVLDWMINLVLPPHIRSVYALSYGRSFNMVKGDKAGLPDNALTLKLGLGWQAREDCDVDGSCISLDINGNIIGCVYHEVLSGPGITHSGNDLTGEGEGDDEIITVKLTQLDKRVCQLVFLIMIYSEGMNFSDIFYAYVRLMAGPQMKELAFFPLSSYEGGNVRGTCLVFSRLYRTSDGWQFQAIGEEANASTPKSNEAEEIVKGLTIPSGISNAWMPTQAEQEADLAIDWNQITLPLPRVRPEISKGEIEEDGDSSSSSSSDVDEEEEEEEESSIF